jgi:DNA-binding MarR family transcriptional regulator
MNNPPPSGHVPVLFRILTEIAIIEQLSRAQLEAQLPPPLIAPHFAVLSHLSRGYDGAAPIDMARAFQVPKTSMTHTLKGLEQHGYVTLRPNPADGRSKTVWITCKGGALMGQTISAMAPSMRNLMEGFDPQRLDQLLSVLSELRAKLDVARNPESSG